MNQWLSFTTTPAARGGGRLVPRGTGLGTGGRGSDRARRGALGGSAADARAVARHLAGRGGRGARDRRRDHGAQSSRRARSPALGAGTPGGLELSASDGRGWPAHGGAVAGGAVAGAPGNVAAAVRHRVRDRRRVLGPHRPRDGGLFHDLRRRGAARTGGVRKMVGGGRVWWAAHRGWDDHCPEGRWVDREERGRTTRARRTAAAGAP